MCLLLFIFHGSPAMSMLEKSQVGHTWLFRIKLRAPVE